MSGLHLTDRMLTRLDSFRVRYCLLIIEKVGIFYNQMSYIGGLPINSWESGIFIHVIIFWVNVMLKEMDGLIFWQYGIMIDRFREILEMYKSRWLNGQSMQTGNSLYEDRRPRNRTIWNPEVRDPMQSSDST